MRHWERIFLNGLCRINKNSCHETPNAKPILLSMQNSMHRFLSVCSIFFLADRCCFVDGILNKLWFLVWKTSRCSREWVGGGVDESDYWSRSEPIWRMRGSSFLEFLNNARLAFLKHVGTAHIPSSDSNSFLVYASANVILKGKCEEKELKNHFSGAFSWHLLLPVFHCCILPTTT